MQNLDEMVMMTKEEHKKLLSMIDKLQDDFEMLNKSNNMLRSALLYATSKRETETKDVRVSRADFIAIYEKAVDEMFRIMEEPCNNGKTPDDVDNAIYGYEVTVHWHGMYCDCIDGATPSNYIIPAIKGVDEELGGEEY